MPIRKKNPPLQALAFGELSLEERANLARNAIDDQAIFDEPGVGAHGSFPAERTYLIF